MNVCFFCFVFNRNIDFNIKTWTQPVCVISSAQDEADVSVCNRTICQMIAIFIYFLNWLPRFIVVYFDSQAHLRLYRL